MNGDDESPEVRMSPYMSPHDQNSSSILYLTGTVPELEKLSLDFQGLAKDDDDNLIRVGKPLCNQEGASKLVALVGSLANKHGILTHQDDQRISILMRGFSKTVCKSIMKNRCSWGIAEGDRDIILEMTTDLAFMVIQRGFKGGDRGFWKGTQQEVRTSVETPQKGGMFSRLKPWS